MHLPTILIGGALNVGCSVVAGFTILYQTGKYDEFSGTAVKVSEGRFRIKDANGDSSPEFGGPFLLKDGDPFTASFHKPTFYLVAPAPWTAPGKVAQRLWLAVAGMGGALFILSLFQEKKKQMILGNILRVIAVIYITFGLVSSYVLIQEGLQYTPTVGIPEDAGNNKFRVRFPNRDMVSQDMDIPADKPPQFGPYEDYTMYRADYKSVRYLDNKHFFDTVQNVMSAIVIVSGVVGLFIVSLLAQPVAEVHQPPVK